MTSPPDRCAAAIGAEKIAPEPVLAASSVTVAAGVASAGPAPGGVPRLHPALPAMSSVTARPTRRLIGAHASMSPLVQTTLRAAPSRVPSLASQPLSEGRARHPCRAGGVRHVAAVFVEERARLVRPYHHAGFVVLETQPLLHVVQVD